MLGSAERKASSRRAYLRLRKGGVVVGGIRMAKDGQYFVRIPGSTYADIHEALRKLEALPQVDHASPLFANPRSICCGEERARHSRQ